MLVYIMTVVKNNATICMYNFKKLNKILIWLIMIDRILDFLISFIWSGKRTSINQWHSRLKSNQSMAKEFACLKNIQIWGVI